MLIIDKGRKVAEGRKEELLNPASTQVELMTDDNAGSARLIKETKWASFLVPNGAGSILLELKKESIPELNRTLVEKGINVLSLRSRHSLEDLFLSLTTP
jgi:ABC-type multidrug transport system ATPase subunit